MELKEMTIEQLEERKAAIVTESDAPEADLDALTEEIRGINEELENRRTEETKRAEIRSQVAQGAGVVVEPIVTEERKTMPTVEEIRDSKEYIDAFAEYIKTGDPTECRALISENGSGTVAVPTYVYEITKTAWNREGIMSRVRKAYIKGNLKVGFEISGSDAAVHTEGGAEVAEETLVLGIVNLVPETIKKWVSVSDEVLDLRGTEFLDYIYDELTYRIAKKAADELVQKILDCGTVSTTTCPGVASVKVTTASMGTIAEAIGHLSDDAANPVVIMNKLTWSAFKGIQYANNFAADIFEGLDVVYNDKLKSYAAASSGDAYLLVGDLDQGALANFPNGEEIQFKFDELTLATSDLVRVIGRMPVAVGVVAPGAFCKVVK